MNAVLIVIMLIGGVPHGSPIKLQSTTPDCRDEINTVNHTNAVFRNHDSDIRYKILECKIY